MYLCIFLGTLASIYPIELRWNFDTLGHGKCGILQPCACFSPVGMAWLVDLLMEYMGVEPKIGGFFPTKWMVKILENPMNKWMIWGYHFFLETPIYMYMSQANLGQFWDSINPSTRHEQLEAEHVRCPRHTQVSIQQCSCHLNCLAYVRDKSLHFFC